MSKGTLNFEMDFILVCCYFIAAKNFQRHFVTILYKNYKMLNFAFLYFILIIYHLGTHPQPVHNFMSFS